ncbi:MAG: REP-associated tyrosine transposase, partial [Gaiellaceae bacterium]|nr:REP-associated tyrosine transposase [Gaiellaceae bacterium]
MPRILRTRLPDGYFHVTARGVDGTAIFRDDHDRVAYLGLFAETVERHGWSCHAFCLMGNHVHHVLDIAQPTLSAGIQYLHGEYAQRFNNRHERTGHLFGARFASWVIETEQQLQNTIAYVLNNPVRAGLVDDPDDYPWSAALALSEHVFGRYNTVPNGCLRRACRPRRPRAQPEG